MTEWHRICPIWFLFMVTAVLFALLTPPFMYPDEPTHLAYTMETGDPANQEVLEHLILTEMDRHSFWRRANVERPDRIPKAFYDAPLLRRIPTQRAKPTFFYRLSGYILNRIGITSIVSSIFALRLLGVLLAGCSAWLFCLIVRIVFPGSPWQLAALSALAVPQYVYMAGSFNPSNTAWLTGGMMILSALWLLDPKYRYRGLCLLPLAVIATVITHRAALALLPAALVGLALGRGRITRHRIPLWFWPAAGVSLVAIVLISAGRFPLLIRSVLIRLTNVFQQAGATPVVLTRQFDWWIEFIVFFWRSSILNFGWLSHEAPPAIYFFYGGVLGLSVLGGLRGIFQRYGAERKSLPPRRYSAVLWVGAAGMIWAAAARYAVSGALSQGRYLFAAWPVFACLITMGLQRLLPHRTHRAAIRFFIGAVWFIAAYGLWWVWIPGVYF